MTWSSSDTIAPFAHIFFFFYFKPRDKQHAKTEWYLERFSTKQLIQKSIVGFQWIKLDGSYHAERIR